MRTKDRPEPRPRRSTALDQHIAERMRQGRLAAHLTQEYIARKLGITFQQVQKYESGADRISAGRLYQLSIALSLPVPYFFEGLSANGRGVQPSRRKSSRQTQPLLPN